MTDKRFGFGKNWQKFSEGMSDKRVESSIKNLSVLLQTETLEGKSFLDIGSGSGLSTVAALKMGARVHAFDYDQDSVDATKRNVVRFIPNANAVIEQGSALDEDYMSGLGSFDVVHSWGVLHHTGGMWEGLDLAARSVTPGGLFALAIYNDQGGASRRWLKIKKLYVSLPSFLRLALVGLVGLYFEGRAAVARLANFRNPLPFKDWKSRIEDRGMTVWYDLVDWVGGYPFEVAKPEEIFVFLQERGFSLSGIKTCGGGHGCNEFLFERLS